MPPLDPQTIAAAVVGYQQELERIESRMAAIRAQLGGQQPAKEAVEKAAPRRRRVMSRAARQRIADAQKKRWAAFHKAKEQAKPAPPAKPAAKAAVKVKTKAPAVVARKAAAAKKPAPAAKKVTAPAVKKPLAKKAARVKKTPVSPPATAAQPAVAPVVS